ncbi:uncharacterized protein LOC112245404 isoform X2 [Oncorhynchus tshawytscha]|uniref:uncharacterized protein LOC112245404 isoform X2 n=1 Tax=Oncorhynchus tshawytscha TaxID=74940 RepID=UPI001C3DF540|nr:uncharacterized protein LOC112245404 isoform X2 [Oncorhynchus tshawytscha]
MENTKNGHRFIIYSPPPICLCICLNESKWYFLHTFTLAVHQANRWHCCTVVAGETASSGQALIILQNKDQNVTVHRGPVACLLHQSSVRDLHEECHHSERHFDLSSFLIGLFEMGNLLFLAVVSHFGAKLHRPRLIAMGCFIIAVESFLTGLPHFFMGCWTQVQRRDQKMKQWFQPVSPPLKGPLNCQELPVTYIVVAYRWSRTAWRERLIGEVSCPPLFAVKGPPHLRYPRCPPLPQRGE